MNCYVCDREYEPWFSGGDGDDGLCPRCYQGHCPECCEEQRAEARRQFARFRGTRNDDPVYRAQMREAGRGALLRG